MKLLEEERQDKLLRLRVVKEGKSERKKWIYFARFKAFGALYLSSSIWDVTQLQWVVFSAAPGNDFLVARVSV
jgi:hypothetical protein